MRALYAGPVNSLNPPHFLFLLGGRRRGVLVQEARFGFGYVQLRDSEHGHRLLASERAAQAELVADSKLPMRLAALPVDLDLSTLASFLGLRPRAKKAGNVEPDIESNGGHDLFSNTVAIGVTFCVRNVALHVQSVMAWPQ
jgi:hypothetical protein